MRVRGKVAVVTGASSGVGRAVALWLARRGADVALVARREPLLQQLAEQIRAMGRQALVVPADVGTREGVHAAFETVVKHLGAPDILVNSAGIGIWKPFLAITEAEHRAMMDVNYWGVFNWTRCVLPGMRERGHGHIVNVSSAAGKIGSAMSNGYSASKFALTGLSESLHRELLGTGVRISCVHPGGIKTDFANEETMPSELLSPLIRYSPKISAAATARQIGYCIWFGFSVRTFPFFVGLLTRVNALWIRLGDFMLWKWFYPVVALYLLLSFIF